MKNQVFLGGSCNPTTWRADVAIPALTAAGVALYNPQIADWSEKDAFYKAQGIAGGIVEVEAGAKGDSELLLFVIDGQTRSIASMVEVAEYIASGRDVVLVVNNIPDSTTIGGQVVTGGELKDLNRARAYVLDVAKRHPGNVDVFADVASAVEHCVEVLKK